MNRLALIALVAVGAASATPTLAQDSASWAVTAGNHFSIRPNITYLEADGYKSKLDLFLPLDTSTPVPVLLYFHGGGWVGGSKETSAMRLLPYLEKGWAVVNVEYRMARNALAPAAVEDCRCALRWVKQNAEELGLDADRIVVTGSSAGGHLSLTTGMLPASAGFDRLCPTVDPDGIGRVATYDEEMDVAAIVNWYGITDVGDLLAGGNAKTYAVHWMGSKSDRFELAERVSPLTYVRPGLPPVLTLHGNADSIVPYQHALRLHEGLTEAGVENRLHTIEGGGHGGFSDDEMLAAFDVIWQFLEKNASGS